MIYGGRGELRRRVSEGLESLPSWKVFVGKRWVCPFCLTLVKRRRDEEGNEAIVDHLEECRPFDDGKGIERKFKEIQRFAGYRRLRRQSKHNLMRSRSWQLIDVERRWVCPYCAEPTSVRVPASSRMTDETLNGIVDHVEICRAFDKGRGSEQPLAALQESIRKRNKTGQLAQSVQDRLEGDPAWRRKDENNRWVCPYCLVSQAQIDLSSRVVMFEQAPALIARHLRGCTPYLEGSPPQPFEGLSSRSGGLRAVTEEEPSEDLSEPLLLESEDLPMAEVSESGSVTSGRWGRDGASSLGRAGAAGRTLADMDSSGEFLLIDDGDMEGWSAPRRPPSSKLHRPPSSKLHRPPSSKLRVPPSSKLLRRAEAAAEGPSAADAARAARAAKAGESAENNTSEIASWRTEIERSLATVRSGASHRLPRVQATPSLDSDSEALVHLPGFELERLERRSGEARGELAEVIDLGNGRVALAVGSVMGEDDELPAIARLGVDLLRDHAAPERDPADVLQRVNQAATPNLDGRSFLSVTYALLDVATGRLRIARAGGPEPLVVRSGVLHALSSEGMVMGVAKGPAFETNLQVRSFTLEEGDLLVLYGAGVLEAQGSRGAQFGAERFRRLVARYGTHELAYFRDKFFEHFDLHVQAGYRGGEALLLGLRRSPSD